MTYLTTLYPNAKDTSDFIEVIDGVTSVDNELFTKVSSAILAVETELGIKPSGVYSDVRQRLDAMETGLQVLAFGHSPHSVTLSTKFNHNWLSPTIAIPGPSTMILPSVIAKAPINLRTDAGFEDGYGLVFFTNRFYVDSDISSLEFSLWDVTSVPSQITYQSFAPGEHTYSAILSSTITNLDKIYELRVKQISTTVPPININSVIWHSRLTFIPNITDGYTTGTDMLNYALTTFTYTDITDGYKVIDTIPAAAAIQAVALIINASFDVSVGITVGDDSNNARLMDVGDNIPTVMNTYSTQPNYVYAGDTETKIYFPAGVSLTGGGTVIIYYH